MKIYPSLISSDLLKLNETLALFDSYCDGYHIDVMDFHFVPNLTWGPQFVNSFVKATTQPLHVHLMVDNPFQWIDILDLSPIDSFMFHFEAIQNSNECAKLIENIKKKKWQVGIVINPETPVEELYSFLPSLDNILLMSVNPGFSGQPFMSSVIDKIQPLLDQRTKLKTKFDIGIDGGVDKENIALLGRKGIDFVGVASAIFSQKDPIDALQRLYEL